jgi:hypothetical protein
MIMNAKIKRFIYWYCLAAVLILTPIPKYFGVEWFFVQLFHLLIMLLIGFSKKFTLWEIK